MSEPILVVDNTEEHGGFLGPNTDIYVFESEQAAKDEFPNAIHRSELGLGDFLDRPVLWPPASKSSTS